MKWCPVLPGDLLVHSPLTVAVDGSNPVKPAIKIGTQLLLQLKHNRLMCDTDYITLSHADSLREI